MPASFRRKKLASALDIAFASAIFFSPARQAVGEVCVSSPTVSVTYSGSDSSSLLTSLSGDYGISGSNVLFPVYPVDSSNSGEPVASGGCVTVDYASGTSPTYVFGGIDAFNGSIGGENSSVLVEKNGVVLAQGTVTRLYGGYGYSTGATVPVVTTRNGVKVTGGKVNGDVYGGYAYNTAGRATAGGSVVDDTINTVDISAGVVTGTIYGGWAQTGAISTATASDNKVSVSGAAQVKGITGGYASGSGINIVSGNEVNVALGEGGKVEGNIYGGYTPDTGNNRGVGSPTGSVTNNTVNIVSGVITGTQIAGGWANAARDGANVTGNTVNISGGTIKANVYGGLGHRASSSGESGYGGGSVSNNRVIMTGGDVTGNIYGGYASLNYKNLNATSNLVEITGGTVTGNVYGGYITPPDWQGSATYNTVTIGGDAKIDGKVYGGYNTNRYSENSVTGNTVNKNSAASKITQGIERAQYVNFDYSKESGQPDTALSANIGTLLLWNSTTVSISEGSNVLFGGKVNEEEKNRDVITGVSLNKTGEGILTLRGTHTYTGTTTIRNCKIIT
jgi:autotransporter-associated beta strand protein